MKKLQRYCRVSQSRLCIDLKTCFHCLCFGVEGGQSHDSRLSPLLAETKAVTIALVILCEPSYCLFLKHEHLLTPKCWTPRGTKPDWFVFFCQCIVQITTLISKGGHIHGGLFWNLQIRTWFQSTQEVLHHHKEIYSWEEVEKTPCLDV